MASNNTRRREEKLVAALMDSRLQGHQEAVYFVLRGLGMPVTVPSGSNMPRIEVFKAKQPVLFEAVQRLGIHTDGKRAIVEPQSRAPTEADDPEAPVSEPRDKVLSVLAGHKSMPDLRGSLASKAMASSSANDFMVAHRRHESHHALFERLSLPKHAVGRHSVHAAFRDVRAPPTQNASLEPSHQIVQKLLARLVPEQSQSDTEADDVPHWWRMSSGKRMDLVDQKRHCDVLSRPKRTTGTPQGAGLYCRTTYAFASAGRHATLTGSTLTKTGNHIEAHPSDLGATPVLTSGGQFLQVPNSLVGWQLASRAAPPDELCARHDAHPQ